MKKSIVITALLIVASARMAEAAPQTTCPVLGGKINPNLYADADGYRIYVCCSGCIDAIKADPEKYIRKMQADGVEMEKTPSAKQADQSMSGMNRPITGTNMDESGMEHSHAE
jgi:hypothetical protein